MKRVNAVVKMLGALKTTITNENKTETTNFKKAMDWCKSEATKKKGEIDGYKTQLQNAKVSKRQHSAKISTMSYALSMNKKDDSEITNSLAQATSIRAKEAKKCAKEKATNLGSIK